MTQQIGTKLFLELTPVSLIHTERVKRYSRVSKRDGSWILNLAKTKSRRNKTRTFENIITSYLQRVRPQCKLESFYTTGREKNCDAFGVDAFCGHGNALFEAMGRYISSVYVKKLARLSLTKQFNGVLKKES